MFVSFFSSCMQLRLSVVGVLGRALFLKALCFPQILGSGPKLFDPSTEECCCHLNTKHFALVIRIFSYINVQKNHDFNSQVKLCFKNILGRIIFDVNKNKVASTL